jgi:hypothetical protein
MTAHSAENGNQGEVVGKKTAGYPDFGRAMLKEFQFEDGCKSQLWLY